jgi:DNA-binding response OmpR family regulator
VSGVAYRALVVDDEVALAGVLSAYLRRGGFDVVEAHDGRSAVAEARRSEPDLLVLDLGLPLLDGVEVCRSVREFSDCYVIMLTARAEEADKLTGLAVGADDYMTKPFSPRELVARAQAMLRRPRGVRDPGRSGAEPLRIGDLELDLPGRRVSVAGEPVELTPTEFAVLAVLASAPSRAFSRRALIHEVWGPSWVGDEHLVDVHVRNLRRRLGDTAQDARYVQTVRGVGYRCGPGA